MYGLKSLEFATIYRWNNNTARFGHWFRMSCFCSNHWFVTYHGSTSSETETLRTFSGRRRRRRGRALRKRKGSREMGSVQVHWLLGSGRWPAATNLRTSTNTRHDHRASRKNRLLPADISGRSCRTKMKLLLTIDCRCRSS